MSDSIFAFSTGSGVSAIAILRLSGAACCSVMGNFIGSELPPRQAVYTGIFDPDTGGLLDRVIAIFFPSPNSFTGEDCLEIHCHGSIAVKSAIVDALCRFPGCRLAVAGEFTKRAFLNNKMDLSAAEGLADLLAAKTEAQRKQALGLVEGHLHRQSFEWRSDILSLLGLIEACVDFADEGDAPDQILDQVCVGLSRIVEDIKNVLSNSHRGQIIRDGFRVALCGPPNSGKSTLLNWLSRREVALVSPEAGTTRDLLEVDLNVGGSLVTCVDGAGIRVTDIDLERRGIDKMREVAASSDLVVWLSSVVDECPVDQVIFETSFEVLEVSSKIDLAAGKDVGRLSISVSEGIGLEGFLDAIEMRVVQATRQSCVITNGRQRFLVGRALNYLRNACDGIGTVGLELLAEELRMAAGHIGELSGEVGPEEVLGEIFGRFCIGK